jgi:hypothetical protein
MKAHARLLSLLLVVFVAVGVKAQNTQTTFLTGASSTANGNHETSCPISITEQDGQSYPPGSGAVCFQASSFDSANWCTTSGSAGPCLTLDFPAPALGTSGIFESGVVTSSSNQFTYCTAPTIPGTTCGVNSTYTQTITFNFWDRYTGTLVLNFLRHNTFKTCSGYRCVTNYNDSITSGSGTIQAMQ